MAEANLREQKNKFWFKVLLFFSLFFIGSGFLFNTPKELLTGYLTILKSSGLLLSDYMAIGNVGSAFLNVGLMTLMGLMTVKINKTDITGLVVAGYFHIVAFSFFGKDIYNSIAPMVGVYFYSRFIKEEFRKYVPISLFASGVGPIVSYLSFHSGFNLLIGSLLGNLLGMIIGFLLSLVATNSTKIHSGYNLYNAGFAMGLISIIAYAVLIMFNIEIVSQNSIYRIFDIKIVILMYFLFILLVLSKFLFGKEKLSNYLNLLKEPGIAPCDFIEKYESFTVLMNMGLIGIIGLTSILLVEGNINGITIGSLLAAVGFAAFGCHPKNYLPLMLGVYLGGYLSIYDINSESVISAAMFSSALSPVAGSFGLFSGLITGFLHLALVNRTGHMHGGFVLYNNGFAAGLIASVVTPFFQVLAENYSRKYHRNKRQ